jgi:hypothetical protein
MVKSAIVSWLRRPYRFLRSLRRVVGRFQPFRQDHRLHRLRRLLYR